MDTKGVKRGEMNGETGVDVYTLLCGKRITAESLLYSPGDLSRKEIQKRGMYVYKRVSQVAPVVKNSTASAGDIRDTGSIPGFSGRSPWRRAWQPTTVFLPEKFHRQRSLAGYCPWGHKESNTTEQLMCPLPVDT